MENNKEIVEKSRSGSFPTLSLEDAVKTIEEGASGGWEMSKDTFAKAIGGSTANSGAFIVKLAALREYGFLERGALIKYTSLAKEIVAPKSEDSEEMQSKRQQAFLSSNVFRSLYEKIKTGPGESSVNTIGNLGVHDFKVAISKKDLFAKNFVSSGKYAGLLAETVDGKIKPIEKMTQKDHELNLQAHSMHLQDQRKKIESQSQFEYSDSGIGWNLSINSVKPLGQEIRKTLVDITALLEGINED